MYPKTNPLKTSKEINVVKTKADKNEAKKIKTPKTPGAEKKTAKPDEAEVPARAEVRPDDKITADTLISDVLQIDETLADVFYAFGMHCLGCPISNGESIGEAAGVHGIDTDELLETLNSKIKKT